MRLKFLKKTKSLGGTNFWQKRDKFLDKMFLVVTTENTKCASACGCTCARKWFTYKCSDQQHLPTNGGEGCCTVETLFVVETCFCFNCLLRRLISLFFFFICFCAVSKSRHTTWI